MSETGPNPSQNTGRSLRKGVIGLLVVCFFGVLGHLLISWLGIPRLAMHIVAGIAGALFLVGAGLGRRLDTETRDTLLGLSVLVLLAYVFHLILSPLTFTGSWFWAFLTLLATVAILAMVGMTGMLMMGFATDSMSNSRVVGIVFVGYGVTGVILALAGFVLPILMLAEASSEVRWRWGWIYGICVLAWPLVGIGSLLVVASRKPR